jgi:hypothetical protein
LTEVLKGTAKIWNSRAENKVPNLIGGAACETPRFLNLTLRPSLVYRCFYRPRLPQNEWKAKMFHVKHFRRPFVEKSFTLAGAGAKCLRLLYGLRQALWRIATFLDADRARRNSALYWERPVTELNSLLRLDFEPSRVAMTLSNNAVSTTSERCRDD